MAWVIRKAGVTKTFTTTWLTTWSTSYTTNWVTSWSSSYTTYTYQNTNTSWTSVVEQYAGETPVIGGYNNQSTSQSTTTNTFIRNSEVCAVAGSCSQAYDSQLGGWYADNCPPTGPCGYNMNSSPNLLGNGVVFSITYYSPQTVAINGSTSYTTSWNTSVPYYVPSPVYNYTYYNTSRTTSTFVSSNNTNATLSVNTSRNTSNNTSQNTSRITS